MSFYDGDDSDLSKLDNMLGDMLKKFPEERKKLVFKAGDMMEQKVKENLSQHKDTGKTLQAVKRVNGSGGGYAAVRNDWSICQTTHLLENGYTPKPRGANKKKKAKRTATVAKKRYKVKSDTAGQQFVIGHHCYRNALLSTQGEIITEAEKMAEKLVGDTFG